MGLKAADIKYILKKVSFVIEQNREYLTELDSAIGDADHGINMNKGFRAAVFKIEDMETDDIGNLLKSVGMALVANVGGASGPLYGTAFIKAGMVSAGKTEIGIDDFVMIMDAAIEGIKMRGKAILGDKTMLDALEPALNSLIQSLSEDIGPIEALEKAKDAARDGAVKTREFAARKGRASYLGPRSIGHQDPGATSSYLILDTVCNAVKELNIKDA